MAVAELVRVEMRVPRVILDAEGLRLLLAMDEETGYKAAGEMVAQAKTPKAIETALAVIDECDLSRLQVALDAPVAAWSRLGFKATVMRAIVAGNYEVAALRVGPAGEANTTVHLFLANRGPATRVALVDSLVHLGAPGLKVLGYLAIHDTDFLIRCRIAKGLASFGAEGRKLLMEMAEKDKEYTVRQRAAEALQQITGA